MVVVAIVKKKRKSVGNEPNDKMSAKKIKNKTVKTKEGCSDSKGKKKEIKMEQKKKNN